MGARPLPRSLKTASTLTQVLGSFCMRGNNLLCGDSSFFLPFSFFSSFFSKTTPASDGGDGDLLDQFDDGFAEQGVGDDVIPTYDLETLEEIGDAGFVKTKASAEAEAARAAQRQGDKVRVGTMKRANPLDELRSVFKTSGGLKLSRDFTERYLFKISADGYHVGWVKDAGSDYDFYNTKHEIVHTEEKTEMPQLSNPKLLGSGDPSGIADVVLGFGE